MWPEKIKNYVSKAYRVLSVMFKFICYTAQ